MNHDLDISPIDRENPIKVYVATQEEQMLSVKVLEYSIKKRTDEPVEVFPLHESNITYRKPKDKKNWQRTPFSFQRFLIPQLNKFTGRAIYIDSDMQVFKDINSLWSLPMVDHDVFTVQPRKATGRVLQFSVMLLNCEQLKHWKIDAIIDQLDNGDLTYEDLMYEMNIARDLGIEIPHYWNCLEWFDKNETALIHYTDMNTQPWVSHQNPLCHLWMVDLIDAVKEGFITKKYIQDHIDKGWIRPSLMYQVENNVLKSKNLPKDIIVLDNNFIAPFKSIHQHGATPFKGILSMIENRIFRLIHGGR